MFDVEYIYSILLVYFEMKGVPEKANAGQYFKEILSIISNSANARIVVLEKDSQKTDIYLNSILNKYCQN